MQKSSKSGFLKKLFYYRKEILSSGRRRYRCDTDHRDYCSSLLERYEVPPAQEAVDDNDDDERPEEQVQIQIDLQHQDIEHRAPVFACELYLCVFIVLNFYCGISLFFVTIFVWIYLPKSIIISNNNSFCFFTSNKGVAQQLRPGEEAQGKDEFEILRHTVLVLLLLLSMFIGELKNTLSLILVSVQS